MIDEDMYGIIPKEKSEAFSKAPPTNMLNKPNKVSCNLSKAPANALASTPGMGIWAPILTTIKIEKVKNILSLNSGMLKIVLILFIIK